MAEERIDNVVYEKNEEGRQIKETPFFTGPGEFLVQAMVLELRKDTAWKKIFGEFIDAYMRMDYSIRSLPALRIYNTFSSKKFESWFIEGPIKADIILPASLRRNDTQQVQDTLSAALLQQFRRPEFFATLCTIVPGLNELGKEFDVDKSLGFEFEDTEVPLTQITLNFRLDLRVWDQHLEDTYRTKDSPYSTVLGDLEKLAVTINALKDGETEQIPENIEVESEVTINTTGE